MTEPPASPTLGALRPQEGSAEVPLHRRTIDVEVYERDGHMVVIGTLSDQRPWASGRFGPRQVHLMELGIVVRCSDLVIVDAVAKMGTFPHAECPDIEGAFSGLIGLSVTRGYTSAVQERFGRARGCSHLEFLARVLGPVVIQALTASSSRLMDDGVEVVPGGTGLESGLQWMTNTCHVWAEDGVGLQKLAAGWRPGIDGYPSPSLVEIRRRRAEPPG